MLNLKFITLVEISICLILFLMMFVPFEQQLVKISLLLFVVVSVIIMAVMSSRKVIDTRVLVWFLFLICTGLFFVLWGNLNGYSDSIKVLPVFVIWPIAYIFMLIAVVRMEAITIIYRVMVFSGLAISLYSIGYMLSVIGLMPKFSLFSLVKESNFADGAEFFSYGMPSITSMLYLVPFTLSALLLWKNEDGMPITRFWLGVALIVGMGPVVFSSTRIFWVIILLTPVLTLLFALIIHQSQRVKVVVRNFKKLCVNVMVLLLLIGFIFFRELYDFIEAAFNSPVFLEALTFSDKGTSVRTEQMKYLLDGWSNNPLLGAGHGASLSTYRRAGVAEWAYEQTFFALLFQTGLIGVLLYFLEFIWIFYIGIKLSRTNEKTSLYLIPALVGMACFLLANGTNPYLYAFDHLWTVFIPLIMINYFLIKKTKFHGLAINH
jgi:hypothetical protein